MYTRLWRAIPVHWVIKTIGAIAIFLAVAYFMMTIGYPWIDSHLGISGLNTIGD